MLVGVGGGIAAYKAPDLVRRLLDRGAAVRVVMTAAAQAFVAPLTFQAVSGQPVRTALLDDVAESGMGHIELARWADLILIAPATADLIARLRCGLASDLLTTLCLATEAPLALAPAMNRMMWAHPATAANVACLQSRGVHFIGPADGSQACGETGAGRMVEPAELAQRAWALLRPAPGPLVGCRALVTAGPTYEALDPVRYLGNRSSGKMGFAVAASLAAAGASVTLVAGPVHLPTPPGVAERIDVTTALAMHAAVMARARRSDLFVAAAAVADFRPAACQRDKIKKAGCDGLTLELVRNPDILAEVASLDDGPFTVGFAAETKDVEAYALEKLRRKGLDLIAANRVGAGATGFDADDNELVVLSPTERTALGRAPKRVLADRLVGLIVERLRTIA